MEERSPVMEARDCASERSERVRTSRRTKESERGARGRRWEYISL